MSEDKAKIVISWDPANKDAPIYALCDEDYLQARRAFMTY